MSKAQEDVRKMYESVRDEMRLCGGEPPADELLMCCFYDTVTLLLERLDDIANEIRHANNKGVV
jgi:hypothetical protein